MYIPPRQPPQCRLQQQQRRQQQRQQGRWNSDQARRREGGDEVAGKEVKAVGESETGLRTPVEGEGKIEVEIETETGTETIAGTNGSQVTSTTTTSTRTSPEPGVTGTSPAPAEAQAEADATANVNPDGTEGPGRYSRSKKAPAKGAFRYVEEPGDPKPTVFVSNLFFDINADDLRQHMEQFGVVENATVITDSRGISKG